MVKGVLMGKGQRAEILVIPVTTLFAFTTLRSTMPGAPESFGESNDSRDELKDVYSHLAQQV